MVDVDETICILHSPYTFEKLMTVTILQPAMDRLGSLTLVWQPVKENEN